MVAVQWALAGFGVVVQVRLGTDLNEEHHSDGQQKSAGVQRAKVNDFLFF